ncbi:MAG: HlyD family type I secretion periplasmic adaptor subunit [Alphaproteobacteria bacterium]|nr:HlyD family type I secretion periplasmic adaptor subunit [Alphaproteobacteria bacterium]
MITKINEYKTIVFDRFCDLFEIIKHHAAIAKMALIQEKANGDCKFKGMNNHEKDFLPAVLEITEKPPSPASRILIGFLIGVFTLTILWACFGKIDIIATARGKLIPASHAKVIQPLEDAIITEILVEDGSSVKTGQPLIKLNSTQANADITSTEGELTFLRIEAQRLKALATSDPLQNFIPPKNASKEVIDAHKILLKNEEKEKQAKIDVINSNIEKQKAQLEVTKTVVSSIANVIPNLKERVASQRGLVKKGVRARMPFLELEQELIEKEEEKKIEEKRLDEIQATIKSLEKQIHQVETEFQKNISERYANVQQQINTREQELIKAKERGEQTIIKSPVNGVVQELATYTVGGVVTTAQQLMTIVPNEYKIEAEAMVLNKDIGFVYDGQEAEVKLDSFPFTKYGTIPAQLRHVYHDAVNDENLGLIYPARLTLSENTIRVNDKDIPITAGMSATIEIKTGKRRVIEYILSPIMRYKQESIRER